MLDKDLKLSLCRYWPVLLVQPSAAETVFANASRSTWKSVCRDLPFKPSLFGLTSNNLRGSDGFRLSSNRIRKIQKVTASDYDSSMNVNNRVAG